MDKNLIFPHPARVTSRATDEQLVKLAKKSRAFDDKVFEDHPPFFWAAEISSDRLDAWFTRMSPSSLKNYAKDAAAGVSFQNSHNSRELGFGRSLTGEYEKQGEEGGRVVAEFYTIPDLTLNSVATNDLILGIRSGIISDVSIGFYGGEFICSICGVDMFDWEAGCRHWPGDEVEIKDKDGKVTKRETVFAWVANAHLSEVSAVYDGATPGASILKARMLSDAGMLKPEAARLIEQRYRYLNVTFPDARHIVPVGKSNTEVKDMEGIRLTDGTLLTLPEIDAHVSRSAAIRATLDELDISKGKDHIEGVRALLAEITRLRAIEESVATIRAQAEDGKKYRSSLIAEAVKQGIRAHGNDFKVDEQRTMLESLSLDSIKLMSESWRKVGDALFGGGRQTEDQTDPEQRPKKRAQPVSAFKV